MSLILLEHSVVGAGCGRHVAGAGDLGGRRHGLGGVELVAPLEVGVVRDGRGDALVPGLAPDHGLVDQRVVALGQHSLLQLLLINGGHLLVLGVKIT